MSDTTRAAGRRRRHSAPRSRRGCPARPWLPLLAGLIAGLCAGLLADGAGSVGTVRPGGASAARPRCPKLFAPATPPARMAQPAPPPDAPLDHFRPAPPGGPAPFDLPLAGAGDPGRPGCKPPAINPSFLVPDPARPAPADIFRAAAPHERWADRPATPAGMATRSVAGPEDHLYLDPHYPRALIYSGVVGFVLALAGAVMVGHRSRPW